MTEDSLSDKPVQTLTLESKLVNPLIIRYVDSRAASQDLEEGDSLVNVTKDSDLVLCAQIFCPNLRFACLNLNDRLYLFWSLFY
jgi:hypothetical protein